MFTVAYRIEESAPYKELNGYLSMEDAQQVALDLLEDGFIVKIYEEEV